MKHLENWPCTLFTFLYSWWGGYTRNTVKLFFRCLCLANDCAIGSTPIFEKFFVAHSTLGGGKLSQSMIIVLCKFSSFCAGWGSSSIKKIDTASKVFLVVTCGCLGPAVKTTNTRVVSWPSTGSYWAASSAWGWWCPPRRGPVPQCLPRPSLPSAPAGSSVWPSTSWSRGTWARACEGRDPPSRRCRQGKDGMCLAEREVQDSKVVFQCGTCQEKISEVVAVNLLNLELQEMLKSWISILSVFHQDQSGTQQGQSGYRPHFDFFESATNGNRFDPASKVEQWHMFQNVKFWWNLLEC